jgi:hypothetical protein
MFIQGQQIRHQGITTKIELVLGLIDQYDYLIRWEGDFKPVMESELEAV